MATAKKKPASKKVASRKKPAKKSDPRQPGAAWLSPYLYVKDVTKAIAYLRKAFDFGVKEVVDGPDGKPMHAELTYEDAVVMLGRSREGLPTPKDLGGTPGSLYLYVPDVDSHYRKACKVRGGKVAQKPADMFYGDRTYSITDPDGHVWGFATAVRYISPDDFAFPKK